MTFMVDNRFRHKSVGLVRFEDLVRGKRRGRCVVLAHLACSVEIRVISHFLSKRSGRLAGSMGKRVGHCGLRCISRVSSTSHDQDLGCEIPYDQCVDLIGCIEEF